MRDYRFRMALIVGALVVNCGIASDVMAGGCGLNTVVVINQNSSNSCELGNYFCERRQVPPENVLYITWTNGKVSWTSVDFQTLLLNPLLAMVAERQLTNQIDYVVISMDLPFQIQNGISVNSTTSALFYGLKTDSGPDSVGITNSYAGSEQIFRQAGPASATGYSFLASMITGDTLAHSEQVVDQGVLGDATFPQQPIILAKSSDPLRNLRYHAFDNASFNARILGNCTMLRTNSDSPLGQTNLSGYETGLANFSVSPGAFVPGAIADSMTSFGGIIFGPNNQTTLLAFLNAGAAGSYGTVTEPAPDPEKFPDPQVYFYQSRGFTLAEAYYQSLVVPYQGLIVGEPLSAPFQSSASGQWSGVTSNAILSGTALLSLQFTARDWRHPLQQIDLFVDGKYFQTLTNLPPLPGNLLTVTLNGPSLTYQVPAGASIASVANDLTALINASAATNLTGIVASVYGDRVELRSSSTNRPAPPSNLGVLPVRTNMPARGVSGIAGTSSGTAAALTTFLIPSRNIFMASVAAPLKACTVGGSMQIGAWLQINITKTNGARVSLAVTNQSPTASPFDLTGQLVSLINSSSNLQGIDGIVADDLVTGFSGGAAFNLYARAAGLQAGAMRVGLAGSTSLVVVPDADVTLEDNLSDLEWRNHLYVAAGATNLAVTFPLDTTGLADGYHELIAVAVEGNHVRTPARITLPVRIQNSSVSAALSLLDLASPAPMDATYHIQVTANTNSATACTLFTTGGALTTISNQPSATFTVNGASLGAGLHPFYAIVTFSAGPQYRTDTQWIRFVH